jgi:hypothetical protein
MKPRNKKMTVLMVPKRRILTKENDDGLHNVRWRLMLVRDNINDLFDQNHKEIMKRQVGRMFDKLYNQIAED